MDKAQEMKQQRRERMLTAPLRPLLIKTAIPTMLGMLVTMLYNLTDTFWIARLNDEAMTAAVGIVFAFVSVVQALGFWFGYGSGNVMSRRLGVNREQEAAVISADGLGLAIGSGLLLLAASAWQLRPLAVLLGGDASEKLLEQTMAYLRLLLPSIPFSLYATTLYNQLRLCGNVKDGMLGLLSGMLVNMVLDPILILGLGMGTGGAGLATSVGQVIGAIVLTRLSFLHGNIPAGLRLFDLRQGRWKHILAGGAPNFTRQGITSLASVLLNRAAVPFGTSVIAALTISGRIASLVYMLMIGFGQGFQPICAMNFGAKQYDRVRRAFRLTVTIGTVFLTAASVLLYLFARPLTGIFTTDEAVLAAGCAILRYQCFALPLLGYYAVSSMYMQNIGKYGRALIISVSRQGFCFIPLVLLLPRLWGVTGLYLAQPLADALSFVIAIAVLLLSPLPENNQPASAGKGDRADD